VELVGVLLCRLARVVLERVVVCVKAVILLIWVVEGCVA